VATFELDVTGDGDAVVRMSGEIDLAVVDEVLSAAREGLAHHDGLRLDLSRVTFIDSTGLGALVRVRNESAAEGKSLTLVDVPASLVRLLDITGLHDMFTVVGGVDADDDGDGANRRP